MNNLDLRHRAITRTGRMRWMALAVFAVAAIPRVLSPTGHSIFCDEILWLGRGITTGMNLRRGKVAPSDWAFLRHPGVVTAALTGLVLAMPAALERNYRWESVPRFELEHYGAVRVAFGLLGAATCVALFWLAHRATGNLTMALIASLLLAVSPFHAAMSRWVHVDQPATFFLTVAMLCFYVGQVENRPLWKAAAGVAYAFAYLSKLTILAALPALVAWRLWMAWRARGTTNPENPADKGLFAAHPWRGDLIFLVTGVLIAYVFYPRAWLDPLFIFRSPFNMTSGAVASHANFFMGRPMAAAPPSFYWVMMAMRAQELLLVGLLCATVLLVRAALRKRPADPFILLIVLWWIAVPALLGTAGKQGDRYILPAWPAMTLIAAAGLTGALDLVSRRRTRVAQRRAMMALVAVILVVGVVNLVRFFPNLTLYYNSLAGGPGGASGCVLLYGAGEKEVAEFLARDLQPDAIVDVAGHETSVAFYMPPQQVRTTDELAGQPVGLRKPADYLVLFQHVRVRFPEGPSVRYARDHVPIKTIRIAGADLAWVYRMAHD